MSTSAPTPKPPTGNLADTPEQLLPMMLEVGARYIAAAPDGEDAGEMQQIITALNGLVVDADEGDTSTQANTPGDAGDRRPRAALTATSRRDRGTRQRHPERCR